NRGKNLPERILQQEGLSGHKALAIKALNSILSLMVKKVYCTAAGPWAARGGEAVRGAVAEGAVQGPVRPGRYPGPTGVAALVDDDVGLRLDPGRIGRTAAGPPGGRPAGIWNSVPRVLATRSGRADVRGMAPPWPYNPFPARYIRIYTTAHE